ncbi:MAG: hypothetical protein ACR2OZ_01910 [Verrucomicrobiales bacterium]
MNSELTTADLRRAVAIRERIEVLEGELSSLLRGLGGGPAIKSGGGRKKRRMSAQARARISAAQKARWERVRREKGGR